MRSRNITFDGKGFKPQSRMYAFFDGINMTSYCVPKLLEISMKSGVFQVGETVTGEIFSTNSADPAIIKFKVAVSNHKEKLHLMHLQEYTQKILIQLKQHQHH